MTSARLEQIVGPDIPDIDYNMQQHQAIFTWHCEPRDIHSQHFGPGEVQREARTARDREVRKATERGERTERGKDSERQRGKDTERER